MKRENMVKALHSISITIEDLQSVLAKSTRLEAIIILPMIKSASELRRDLENLISAIDEVTP